MLVDNLRLLLRLYYRPLAAMSGIIDEGSLLFSALAALLVSVLLGVGIAAPITAEMLRSAAAQAARAQRAPSSPVASEPSARSRPRATPGSEAAPEPADDEDVPVAASPRGPLGLSTGLLVAVFSGSMVSTVFSLALLYAPATLFLVTLFERVGSLGVAFRRDYGSLLACTLMAWAAAFLPVSLAALVLPAFGGGLLAAGGLAAAGAACFLGLMVCAVRTVFGARLGSALGVVGLSWVSFFLQGYLPLLASPFLLYWGYQYFRGDIGDITFSFGARQSFKRYLEAATINPRDANAHYQLGLIHQQRHQISEAIERFRKAVEIDASELDAHYQLGRIARQQRRHEDAIKHFDAVVTRDERFARHEVWREIGGTYLESGSLEHARWSLEKYVGQRSHDPEGLFLLGEALTRLGDGAAARRQFEACVEAVETTPGFRRREVQQWGKLARQRLGRG